MTIMHRKYLGTRAITTITVGVTAESAVTPTVIVVLSLIRFDSNLFSRKKGHEWPKLKIISASKAENKKEMAQICCL